MPAVKEMRVLVDQEVLLAMLDQKGREEKGTENDWMSSVYKKHNKSKPICNTATYILLGVCVDR